MLLALCAFGGGFLVSLHLDDGGEAGLNTELLTSQAHLLEETFAGMQKHIRQPSA